MLFEFSRDDDIRRLILEGKWGNLFLYDTKENLFLKFWIASLVRGSCNDHLGRVHTQWFSQLGAIFHFNMVNAFFKIAKPISAIRKGNQFGFWIAETSSKRVKIAHTIAQWRCVPGSENCYVLTRLWSILRVSLIQIRRSGKSNLASRKH